MIVFLQVFAAWLWISALVLTWLMVLGVLEPNDSRVLALMIFFIAAVVLTVLTVPFVPPPDGALTPTPTLLPGG